MAALTDNFERSQEMDDNLNAPDESLTKVKSQTHVVDVLPTSDTEESLDQMVARLARERPSVFPTKRSELGFCLAIFTTQILTEYFVSGFNIILPTLIKDLNIDRATSVWPATAFSLSVASTLLVFGRLADRYGAYVVHIFGIGWLAVWSIVAGFSVNPLMLIIARSLQGIGPAAFLPTGVMLIGSNYRPGYRKNLVFSLYGSSAVAGFYLGILLAGVVGEHARWGWYFWIGAVLSALTMATAMTFVPNDRKTKAAESRTARVDWLGGILIVSGLVLLVFSITQSAHATNGWKTPYIPTLFSLSIMLLLAAAWHECRASTTHPILPPDVFAVPGMTPLTIALGLLYGTLGIYLVYGTQYFIYFMGVNTLQVVAWYTPMALGGILLAAAEGYLLALMPGRVLLVLSGLGALGSQLLLSFVPPNGNYWAWIMPSMILGTVGIDLSITLVMVFVTTTMPFKRQGLAGGLVNSVMQLGMAICIGLSDIILEQTMHGDEDVSSTHLKSVFYFGSALGGTSLVLMMLWGKIPKATSDLTADEKLELHMHAQAEITRTQSVVSMQPISVDAASNSSAPATLAEKGSQV